MEEKARHIPNPWAQIGYLYVLLYVNTLKFTHIAIKMDWNQKYKELENPSKPSYTLASQTIFSDI